MSGRKRIFTAVVAAGFAVTVAACSSTPDPAPAPPPSPVVQAPGSGQLDVEYRGGQVIPPAEVVETGRGKPIRLHVTSDRHDDIEIAGYPDKTEDVDPGDPEGIDFVPDRAGDIPVRLKAAGVELLTLRVS
jgi:hypothetical protein